MGNFGLRIADCETPELELKNRIFMFVFSSISKFEMRLLDHLNCPLDDLRRNCDADLIGGFEVDRQIKFHRLQQSQIGGLGASENLIDVFSGETGYVRQIYALAHQFPGFAEVCAILQRWLPV